MSWKEFLKPDWRKIAIVIVFGFISLVLSELVLWNYTKIDDLIFTVIFLLPSFILRFIESMYIGYLFTKGIIIPVPLIRSEPFYPEFTPILTEFKVLGWILNVIYWYFLSCLIIWIYDKVKKK